MQDDELDRLIAGADPIDADIVATIDAAGPPTELREAIMNTTSVAAAATPSVHDDAIVTPLRRRGPRWRRPIAAVAVVLAGIVGFTAIDAGTGTTAWAAPLVAFAESSPLLLLDGWEVTRADQYDDEGEMTFAAGDRGADLHWRAADVGDLADDRARSADLVESVMVLGDRAQLSRYAGTDDHAAVWERDGQTLEFRTTADSVAAVESLLAALEPVDVDAWLSAMPESVIQAADRASVIDAMVADIPLPPGFDVASLYEGSLKDRYQLGAEVTGAIGCAWVEVWATDPSIRTEAVRAMTSSDDWAILDEMAESGAWPQVFGIVGDDMAAASTDADIEATVDWTTDAIGCRR